MEKMQREQLYKETLETLKSEHDLLEVQYKQMKERFLAAKSAIRGISILLGVKVEEEYTWNNIVREQHSTRRK